jgi:hypothetical protein
VDGKVDLALQQCLFDLLHEEPLAAHFRQRSLLEPIAGRSNDDDLARGAAGLRQPRGDAARLIQGELAAARAEAE